MPAAGSYWLMVVNASNRTKIVDFIEPVCAGASDVAMTDVTYRLGHDRRAGPAGGRVVQPWSSCRSAASSITTVPKRRIAGHGGIVSRTGYTGEDGYELILGARAVEGVWQALVDAGHHAGRTGRPATPCGSKPACRSMATS